MKFLSILCDFLKSLFFPAVCFLFSYYFTFLHESVFLIKKGQAVGRNERGGILLSYLVGITPGGKTTLGLFFLSIGLYFLYLNLSKLIKQIRNDPRAS